MTTLEVKAFPASLPDAAALFAIRVATIVEHHAVPSLQRRLRDLTASERAQRSLAHRGIFREALTWMEIHGDSPEVVEHWMGILDEHGDPLFAPRQFNFGNLHEFGLAKMS